MFIFPASAVCSLPPQLLHLPNQHLSWHLPPIQEPTITPSPKRGTSLSLQLQTTGASPFNEGPISWENSQQKQLAAETHTGRKQKQQTAFKKNKTDRKIEVKREVDGQTDKTINKCTHRTTACEVWEKKEETEKHQNPLT